MRETFPETPKNPPENVTIEILRLYAKEQSCKVPHGHQALQSEEKPDTQTELSINTQPIAAETYEVTLNITVTTKIQQKTAYTANVEQACVLKTSAKDEQPLGHLINVYIPQIIYPYVRKTLADLIGCAGFTPIFLPIIDFNSMYQEKIKNTAAPQKILEKSSDTVTI